MKGVSNKRFSMRSLSLIILATGALIFTLATILYSSKDKGDEIDLSESIENQIKIGQEVFIMPHLKGFSSAEKRGVKDYIKSISVSKHLWPTIYTYYNSSDGFNCVSFHSLSKFSWIQMDTKKAKKSLLDIFPRSNIKSIDYRGATIFFPKKNNVNWYGIFFNNGLILVRNSKGFIDRNDLFDLTLNFVEKNV
tara:strand:- start:1760 stop:2338 length:579 start_codon:yes stop_codon:yes gene_type:complete